MRRCLLGLLGADPKLVTSYQPRRRGFLITTSRTLIELRSGLPKRWVRRITPIHQPSGRFFLEPTPRLLSRCLDMAEPERWWNERHANAAKSFFSPERRERVRRLPRRRGRTDWIRGAVSTTNLALHLEGLGATTTPEKHWKATAEVFDELWRRVRLYAVPANSLAYSSFAYLRRLEVLCQEQADGIP